MIRVHNLSPALAIWVFGRDHNPPHFHIMASNPDETDVLVEIGTLEIICGHFRRQHLAAGLDWASQPANRAKLEAEWTRLNGQE